MVRREVGRPSIGVWGVRCVICPTASPANHVVSETCAEPGGSCQEGTLRHRIAGLIA
jgi:hypothetical protein